MPVICGIYGYQITRPMELFGLHIEPRTSNWQEAEILARNLDTYNLTATIQGDSITREFLFNFEAVLSFIEHLDVLVTPPIELSSEEEHAQIPQCITTHKRNNGGGAVIGNDTIFPSSRSEFILRAMTRLQDKAFCDTTQFNILFFKSVETFRQLKPFIEIQYFLLYSGLESFARSTQNDRKTRAPKLIFKMLKSYGFDVHIEHSQNLHKAVSTYTHLRNALFHNGEHKAHIKAQGIEIELIDYLFNFSQLVTLVILKAIEFDDSHINWNSWIDRQPFQ